MKLCRANKLAILNTIVTQFVAYEKTLKTEKLKRGRGCGAEKKTGFLKKELGS